MANGNRISGSAATDLAADYSYVYAAKHLLTNAVQLF
jgi:hypothetical protein